MAKFTGFTVPFKKKDVEQGNSLFKSELRHLYHVHWSLGKQLTLKKSLLVICKILSLFVKIFIADDKYSLVNRENLKQLIQKQLS